MEKPKYPPGERIVISEFKLNGLDCRTTIVNRGSGWYKVEVDYTRMSYGAMADAMLWVRTPIIRCVRSVREAEELAVTMTAKARLGVLKLSEPLPRFGR